MESDFFSSLLGDSYRVWQRLLCGLTRERRRVLVGRYVVGKSQSDMAAEFGCTHQNISDLERSALAELRDAEGTRELLSSRW